jgi:hypothetical protein
MGWWDQKFRCSVGGKVLSGFDGRLFLVLGFFEVRDRDLFLFNVLFVVVT